MRRLLTVFATLACVACADSLTPKELLRINVLPDALELMNTSQKSVYVFVAERNTLALMDWAPCSDAATCEGITVGSSMVVPYTDITGYTTGASEAVVYNWHLVPDAAEGFRPDSIRATIIALHVHH